MNQIQLVEMLNATPIAVNVKHVEENIKYYDKLVQEFGELVKKEMKVAKFKAKKDELAESTMISYIEENIQGMNNNTLQKVWNTEEPFEKRINYKFFERYLTSPSTGYGDAVTVAYFHYYEAKKEKKRFETILENTKDGKIQPTFAINKVGILYTSKPAIQFKPFELESLFNCKSHTMKNKSLDDVAKAVANKKAGSTILTVINTTVYYVSGKEAEEQKKMEEVIKKQMSKGDFIPLNSWVGYEDEKMEVAIDKNQPIEHKMEDLANKFMNLNPNAIKAQKEIKAQVELANQRADQLNNIFTNMKNKSKEKEMTANGTV